ncbi:MAG: DoxX family protein [Rhodospirillaceae bacterium]
MDGAKPADSINIRNRHKGIMGCHSLAIAVFVILLTVSWSNASLADHPPASESDQAVTLSEMARSVGRVLIGQIFVISGVRKIPAFSATAARMAGYGLPVAEALLVPTIALEVGGGLMLAANIYPDWAAAALALFVVPTTLIFHNFWSVPNAAVAAREQIQFMKNVAIMGGLLSVFSQGDGGSNKQ